MTEIAVLGTGVVGRTLAFRAAEVGYSVFVGARSAGSGSLEAFAGRDAHQDGVVRRGSRCR